MPSDLVLITGGTGHIGFKVIVDALEAGYSVRAAIRDSSKEETILSAKPIKTINPGPVCLGENLFLFSKVLLSF